MSSEQKEKSDLQLLQQENERLKRSVEELSLLNRLAREVGASLDSSRIIETIVSRSMEAVQADQAVITLVDKKGVELNTLIRAMKSSTSQQEFHLDLNLLGWMQINQKPITINKPQDDTRFKGVNWSEKIRHVLCVPLLVRSELIGVLSAYNKKGDIGFSDDDQRLLAIIANQSAQVIENARLYEEEKALLLVKEDLRLAARIQSRLLPKTVPEIEGYEIAGVSLPAQQVGGDYFDFIHLEKDRLAVCIGDVSGKGLPASLLMANLQATVRGQILSGNDCSKCLDVAGGLLFGCTNKEKYATFFLGFLNYKEDVLSFSNAGHNPSLLFTDYEEPLMLKTGGIPLGVTNNFSYKEDTAKLNKGNILLLYSDGITEAMNAEEKEFGLKRLIALVNRNRKLSSKDLLDEIINGVKTFMDKTPQFDDITLVVIKREG